MSVMFVTGATKNTGLAIAQKFAAEGFDVAISSRRWEDAEQVADSLSKEYGIRAKGYPMELDDTDAIQSVFNRLLDDFGRLDTFVANAAHLGVGFGLLSSTPADFDAVLDVNLKGTFFCCQNAANIMMRNGGGSIVLISSVHANACIPDRCLYSISKGGINTLAKAIAIELGPHGIRANSLAAGAIKTDRWQNMTGEEIAARRRNWPLGMESTGEDIANAAFYLGTDLSRTVTGTELVVDSGVSTSLLGFNGGKRYD